MKANILNKLKESRKESGILDRLRAGSLEARRDKLAEALRNPAFEGGPAELVATYPKHVLASKDGVLMRISLDESEDSIKFGKIEIFEVPVPASTIGAEVMETARSAATAILENSTDVGPMLASITQALDIKGTVSREIDLDVKLRSLRRDSWWDKVVQENFAIEPLTLPVFAESKDPAKDLDAYRHVLRNEASEFSRAVTRVLDKLNASLQECARDIADDLKSVLTLVNQVNLENTTELSQVCETLELVAPRLIRGARFLVHLSNQS